ncbi:hypothetical protein GCM10010523_32260 [Paenarthrobacter ilicis]
MLGIRLLGVWLAGEGMLPVQRLVGLLFGSWLRHAGLSLRIMGGELQRTYHRGQLDLAWPAPYGDNSIRAPATVWAFLNPRVR